MISRGCTITVESSSIGCIQSFTAPSRMQKWIEDNCINATDDRMVYTPGMYDYENFECSIEYSKAALATLFATAAAPSGTYSVLVTFKDGGVMSFEANLEKAPTVASGPDAKMVINTSWKVMGDVHFSAT